MPKKKKYDNLNDIHAVAQNPIPGYSGPTLYIPENVNRYFTEKYGDKYLEAMSDALQFYVSNERLKEGKTKRKQ